MRSSTLMFFFSSCTFSSFLGVLLFCNMRDYYSYYVIIVLRVASPDFHLENEGNRNEMNEGNYRLITIAIVMTNSNSFFVYKRYVYTEYTQSTRIHVSWLSLLLYSFSCVSLKTLHDTCTSSKDRSCHESLSPLFSHTFDFWFIPPGFLLLHPKQLIFFFFSLLPLFSFLCFFTTKNNLPDLIFLSFLCESFSHLVVFSVQSAK